MFSRLQALKTIIESGNTDELEAELNGLVMENKGVSGLEKLLECFETSRHEDCIALIEKMMAAHQPPVKKEDTDISGLRTEWSICQTRLSVLHHRKQELLRQVNDFRLRHNQKVGPILSRMLFLRKELLLMALGEQNDLNEACEDAKREYRDYTREQKREVRQARKDIGRKEEKELSKLYRQASKMCHPDLVADELREEAGAIFASLNKAYVESDLEEVRKITDKLISGGLTFAGKNEGIKEADRLKIRIQQVQDDMNALLWEITAIEESPAYQTVISQVDIDAYFERLKEKLIPQLEELEKEYGEKKRNSAR